MKRVTRSSKIKLENIELPKTKRVRRKAPKENVNEQISSDELVNPESASTLEQRLKDTHLDENENNIDPELLRQEESIKLIKQVLGSKFANIVDRLKLDWTPSCLKKWKDCVNHQIWNEADFYKMNMAKTLFFTNNDQHSKGLILFEDMVISNQLPYGDIFQDLIRYILVSLFR